jgi:insulysin
MKVLAYNLETASLDNRQYRVIRLSNNIEVTLNHDINAEKSAAALIVNVASLADPANMEGTAHAVEHMLFMGTQKVRRT